MGGELSKRQLIRIVRNHFGSAIDIIESTKANKSHITIPVAVSKNETLLQYLEKDQADNTIPLFTSSSEYSLIHKIVMHMKEEMNKIPAFANLTNLDLKDFKKYIPETLIWIVTLLISNDIEETDETRILS